MGRAFLWVMTAILLIMMVGCKTSTKSWDAHSLLFLEAKRAELQVMTKDRGRGQLTLRYVSPVIVRLDAFPAQSAQQVTIAEFIQGWTTPSFDQKAHIVQGGFLFLEDQEHPLLKDVILSPVNPRYDAEGKTLTFDVTFNTTDLPAGQIILQNVRVYMDQPIESNGKTKPTAQNIEEPLNFQELS